MQRVTKNKNLPWNVRNAADATTGRPVTGHYLYEQYMSMGCNYIEQIYLGYY